MKLELLNGLADAREQLASNARLRLGLGVVVFILWLYAMLAAQDATVAFSGEAAQLAARVESSHALAKQTVWPERVKQAERQIESIQALIWTEPEQGLAEARMQDWVTALAAKSGLVLRESSLIRADVDQRSEGARTSEAAALPPGYVRIRMRLVADFQPSAASIMLAEMAQGDRMFRVERMRILTATRPALLEMELGSLARIGSKGGK